MTSYCVCLWLTSVSMMLSGFINIAANSNISFFSDIWVMHCMWYTARLLKPLVYGWAFELFPGHGHCKHAAVMPVHVSFWFTLRLVSGYIPSSGIAGSYGIMVSLRLSYTFKNFPNSIIYCLYIISLCNFIWFIMYRHIFNFIISCFFHLSEKFFLLFSHTLQTEIVSLCFYHKVLMFSFLYFRYFPDGI